MPTLNEQAIQAGSRCTRRIWLDEHEPKPRPSLWRVGRALQRSDLLATYAEVHEIVDVVARHQSWTERLSETANKLSAGANDIIGACFEGAGVRATVDHIRRTDSGWVISSVRAAANAKSTYTASLAHAMWVMTQCGMTVTDAEIVTIDPHWTTDQSSGPFLTKRVSSSAETRCTQLDDLIPRLIGALASDKPDPTAGSHCFKPIPCPHFQQCQPTEPKHGLRELYRVKAKILKQLDAQGITQIGDIPDTTALPSIAERQRQAHASGEVAVSSRLRDALSQISRPTVYIDFEAIQPAIPPWPQARPFGVIPVQVSIHTLDEDDQLTHLEWLARPGQDPRPGLARFLADHLSNDATLVAYHSSFELNVLQRLEEFCHPEEAEVLAQARSRFVDMLPMVREHVYHPDFKGKFSLKSVVEALIPEFSYRDLEIRRGDEASLILEAHCRGKAEAFGWSEQEREAALLAYCGRDTLVMVHLEAILRELVGRSEGPHST